MMALELLKPIQKRSAEAQATDALRDQILRGGARPGSRLTEIGLSQQLSVSRSTIRTALHQLANEGLVVQVPYTDWQVASLSGADAWELYTLRASLEALGTRLAVGALTQEGEQMIVAAQDALIQACHTGDRVAIADQDLDLHSTIVGLSGHRRLSEHYRLVRQQIRLYMAWSDALMPDVDAIIETHRWLVDAMLQRDADQAASVAHDHCETAGRILAEFLGERVEAGSESILLKSK
jgi:DNA-binding GntR family transcriptional regulator